VHVLKQYSTYVIAFAIKLDLSRSGGKLAVRYSRKIALLGRRERGGGSKTDIHYRKVGERA